MAAHLAYHRNHEGRQALAVAKALWTKRDELAREYDISPTLLLADSTIIEVAERKPHNAAQFRAVRSINERVRIQAGAEQEKNVRTLRADPT